MPEHQRNPFEDLKMIGSEHLTNQNDITSKEGNNITLSSVRLARRRKKPRMSAIAVKISSTQGLNVALCSTKKKKKCNIARNAF